MKRRSFVFMAGLSAVTLVACHERPMFAQQSDNARIAGKWQMTIDTPHGAVTGDLEVQQDGSKISGQFTAEHFGTLPLSGSVEGKKVSLSLEIKAAEMNFGFSGTVEGNKMGGDTQMGGKWSATRQGTAAAKAVLGTVTGFKARSLEFGVTPDGGSPLLVKVGPETDVLTVPPGDTGLAKARSAKVTDIKLGDRVLVSFVDGMTEARRIVLVAADEIARRDEAERADWQQRGVSGIVASAVPGTITLEQRTAQGVKTLTLFTSGKTKVRRYAPDSVKFTDAQPAKPTGIAVGDQVQARGQKSEDGTHIKAEEIVFGTFLTKLGAVTDVHPETREIRIEELGTKKALTIRVTSASQLKMLPDMRKAMMAGHGAAGHNAPPMDPATFDIKKVLEQMPAATIADVKPGSTIVVTSTRGANTAELTAIMLLANADSLVQIAQSQAPGATPGDAISRMHGGMLSGPGGFALPAILQ